MKYQTETTAFELIGDPAPFQVTFTPDHRGETDILKIRLQAPQSAEVPKLKLQWKHPLVDIVGRWTPLHHFARFVPPAFGISSLDSRGAGGAPVQCFFSASGQNRLTIAASEIVRSVQIKAGVHEESACLLCELRILPANTPALKEYEITLLLDTSNRPWHRSLRDCSNWWAGLPEGKVAATPLKGKEPLYSTWYSYHQQFSAEEIEHECRLAKELGMKGVILDDGWQTKDASRGYAYCGDWELFTGKIPDMAEHVKKVREKGMFYMLWYSVPFVGKFSKAYERFKNQLLDPESNRKHHVLDPRYPDVREYLIAVYEKAVRDWGLDGLKLDFIDSFYPSRGMDTPGKDIPLVEDAVDRLLVDLITRLREVKPDILIEFRQNYTGPAMRKYGNMLRAKDCPNDPLSLRVNTVDIRLLAGDTPTHADMIMWHPDESGSEVAAQLWNSCWGVPQISMRLGELSESHRAVLKNYLSLWTEHRDVILGGEIQPLEPHHNYPLVFSRTETKLFCVNYAKEAVRLPKDLQKTFLLVNASPFDNLILDSE